MGPPSGLEHCKGRGSCFLRRHDRPQPKRSSPVAKSASTAVSSASRAKEGTRARAIRLDRSSHIRIRTNLSLAAGARLGPYEILSPLGAGGMGEVYRARDTRLGRDVAVKVLPALVSADPDRLRRFELEAKAASLLNHPHIVAIHDVGTHDGTPYVVSELLEGETLRARLGMPLPSRQAVEYALQIAEGLAAAHDKGIV